MGPGRERRGRAVEEVDGVEERAGAAAAGPEAPAELLDLVAALAGRLGRRGGRHGSPVGGGEVLAADGKAARRVGAREGDGLVGRPARGWHAAAGCGAGRRWGGRGGHGGCGAEAVAEEGDMVRGVGVVITEASVRFRRRRQMAVGARGRRWAGGSCGGGANRGALTDSPTARRGTRKLLRWQQLFGSWVAAMRR